MLSMFSTLIVGCSKDDTADDNASGLSVPKANEIYYTTRDGEVLYPTKSEPAIFGTAMMSSTYEDEKGVLTFASSVTRIGSEAFSECYRLTSITIPDSVTEIGYSAFWRCTHLTSINIPNSVTEIGRYAFGFCTSLTSITVPDSVTKIIDDAFDCCKQLSKVYFKSTTPPILGGSIFFNCASDLKIYVPTASVETYKAADGWSDMADCIEGYDF